MDERRWMDHTADVGAELQAADLPGLFRDALDALVAVMMAAPPRAAVAVHRVELDAPTLDGLLVRWLEEWVFRIQTHRRVPVQSDVAVGGRPNGCAPASAAHRSGAVAAESLWTLEAAVREAPLDPVAHEWQSEVKGVTYHGLHVERTEAGWTAAVVFDV